MIVAEIVGAVINAAAAHRTIAVVNVVDGADDRPRMDRPRLIDAHSHICFNAFKDDAAEVIARAEEEGIWQLAIGSQIDTSKRAVEYAELYEHIWAVVGLHPIHLVDTQVDLEEVGEVGRDGVAFRTRAEAFDGAAYRSLAHHPKTVGIGECGLDYYRIPEGHDPTEVKRRQEETFRLQIALAQELDLPLMVHVRDAHEETIAVLRESYGAWAGLRPRGMIHCYSGTWDQAQQYLAIGLNISFTGVITFKPTKRQRPIAEELWRTAQQVPLDRFHVETDCPYLAPEPHRGKRNEPRFVRHVAEKIAELRGASFAEIARQSVENTTTLFWKMRTET